MTYIALTSSNGAGDVWVKLAEDGYDGAWAVTRLIANKGKHSITLPDLEAGTYLLRPEIIALHEAENIGGAQFYMECVQIEVTSAGTKTLPSGVAIPGTYSATDPGVNFNIYTTFSSYPIPGPAVWDGASAPAALSSKAAVVSSTPAATSSAAPISSAPAASSIVSVQATSAPISSVAQAPTTLITSAKPTSTPSACSSVPASSSAPASGVAQKYYQCGGLGYTGSTTCVEGTNCKAWNPYYSQCV